MLDLAQKGQKLCFRSPLKDSSFKEVGQTLGAPSFAEPPRQCALEVLCQHS